MSDRSLQPVDGYSPGVGRYVAMLLDTRSRLTHDLENFDETDLDRQPEWAPNSIGTLPYHVAAIELDWTFADLCETEEFPEGTDHWFRVDVREDDGRLTPVVEPLDRHLDRLQWIRGHLLAALSGLNDSDLDRVFNHWNPSSGSWIIQHLMQHEAEHRGQIGEIRAALSHQ